MLVLVAAAVAVAGGEVDVNSLMWVCTELSPLHWALGSRYDNKNMTPKKAATQQ